MTNAGDLLKQISTLPQADVIDPADARRWVNGVLRIDPERAAWHVARAGGFGGSDIGALVASRNGDYHPFSSAYDLVKQKLLVLPPERGTDDTIRGTELESFVLARFERHLREQGLEFRLRTDLIELIGSSPHPDYPWLRCSLDAVYEINRGIYIVDAKAPTEEVLESYKKYEDFFDYRHQLHHYRLGAEGKGVHIDGLILAMYEYRRNGIVPFEVAHDPTIDYAIIDAGEHYWNEYVLAGRVPEREVRPIAVPDDEIPADVVAAADAFVVWKILSDYAQKEAKSAREKVEHWVSGVGELGDATLPLGLMHVKAKPAPDVDRMLARLCELGWDDEKLDELRGPASYNAKKLPAAYESLLRSCRQVINAASDPAALAQAIESLQEAVELAPIKEIGDFDMEKVKNALVTCKENPQRFTIEKLTSALPRSQVYAVELAERREHAEQRLSTLVEEISAPILGQEGVEEPDLEPLQMRMAP